MEIIGWRGLGGGGGQYKRKWFYRDPLNKWENESAEMPTIIT